MSLLELLNMLTSKESMGDVYFYLGMFVAGLVGVIGLLVSQSRDIGGAITSGIAAPQLLGGLAKTATGAATQTGALFNAAEVVLCFLLAPFGGDAYAQEPVQMVQPDSVVVKTVVKSEHALEVKTKSGGKQYVKDTLELKVAADDTIHIEGQSVPVSEYTVQKNGKAMMVTVEKKNRVVKSRKGSLLRGMFGHQEIHPAQQQQQQINVQAQQIQEEELTDFEVEKESGELVLKQKQEQVQEER